MITKSSRQQALLHVMKLSESNRTLLVIIFSLALLIGFAIWSYIRLLESQSWSVHTYRVLGEVAELELLTRQDRGLNLCVVTGDARLIESGSWERQLNVRARTLQLLTRDNPAQMANVLELQQHIERWRSEYVRPTQQHCRDVLSGKLTPGPELSNLDVGIRLRNEIQTLLTRISDKEQLLLSERQQKTAQFRFFTSALLLLGIFGILQLIWTFVRAQLRTTRELELANRQLQQTLHEQQRTQIELEEAEARASAVIDNVSYAIVKLATDGTIFRFNRAAERIFGYRADAAINRSIMMLFAPDQTVITLHDLARYADDSEACIVGNQHWVVDGMRRDGHVFPLDLTVSQMHVNGKLYLIALMRDITEQRRVERMKNEFVSTVSHELRTPLTAIRGALGLISGPMAADLPEAMLGLVSIATNNSERLVRLINDILDIEKIEAGHMRFDMTPQALQPLLEQAIQSNQAYADQYQVALRMGEAIPDCKVRVDSDRFMQLMTNLLSNAAKFSPVGGEVTVDVEADEREVTVRIVDHGAGIPPEFQKRMFQKFSQADSSDTRAKGGTGLGLSICKAIVEHMGGSIGFESVQGQGTTMYFTLPVLPTSALAEPLHTAPSTAPRLLVCEDNPDIARLLQMMLQQAGYGVDIAYDASTALQMLLTGRYSAMTLDIDLPGKDGLSLLHELYEHDETRLLRVVVVSAKTEEAQQIVNQSARDEEGVMVVDWIDKPIDQAKLLRSIGVTTEDASGPLCVLHVEDDPDIRSVMGGMLQDRCKLIAAASLAEAIRITLNMRFDVIILDVNLPDGSGLELLRHLALHKISTPVVVFSATELDAEHAAEVSATLIKSRTSDQQLLDTILGLARSGRIWAMPQGKE